MAAGEDMRGVFITFEGGEGSGKSTHIAFLADVLRGLGYEVLCLREPGGTAVGEKLRGIVLDPGNAELCCRAELLIYEAARAQIVQQSILPALRRGAVVLCDRFTDSTVAYQAYGRGLPRAFVEEANAFACEGLRPHRTILMRTGGSAVLGLERATKDDGADRLEQAGEAFHGRVNDAFLRIAQEEPCRVRTVVSDADKRQTACAVLGHLADLFPQVGDESFRRSLAQNYFDRLDREAAQAALAVATDKRRA